MHLVNAASMCVPASWRSVEPPKIVDWLCRVNEVAEKGKAYYYCTWDTKYTKTWARWHHFTKSAQFTQLTTSPPWWPSLTHFTGELDLQICMIRGRGTRMRLVTLIYPPSHHPSSYPLSFFLLYPQPIPFLYQYLPYLILILSTNTNH